MLDDNVYKELLVETQFVDGDLLQEIHVTKDTIHKLTAKMTSALKSGDEKKRKAIGSIFPKKAKVKAMLEKTLEGNESEFKKCKSHFKSFFKSLKNEKIISNLSNAMACIACATTKEGADTLTTAKQISKKIEAKMKKTDLNESENLNEFVFPTIAVTDETTGFKIIVNLIAGVIQLTAQLGLMAWAYAAAGVGGPILLFIAFWFLWACLPENLQDWWIVIPI